jgi:hypothetical protein
MAEKNIDAREGNCIGLSQCSEIRMALASGMNETNGHHRLFANAKVRDNAPEKSRFRQGNGVKRLTTFAVLIAASASALADPGYYVVSTYENDGEKTIDFRFWDSKPSGQTATYAPEVGVGYGVTGRWYTELYTSYLHTAQAGTQQYGWTWQNDYLLTQGQYPFDLALHMNLQRYHDPWLGYSVEFGPVFQTDVGRTQLNANLFFEREYRNGEENQTGLNYQWQAKYRWRPAFQFGVQGFGELGEWDHWSPLQQQSHRIGPAVFGTLPFAGKESLKYEAGVFAGKIYGQNVRIFSMRLQYVF